MNIRNFVRSNILNLAPYSSARDEFEGAGEVYLDANENPFETGLNRYPDPYQHKVKKELSIKKNIPADQIFLGNGSDEAIDLVIRIFCEPGKDNILIPDPSYGMYAVSAGINDIEVRKVALNEQFEFSADDMLQSATTSSKVAFICSPNNPSGNTLDRREIEKFTENFNGIVVIDEAYSDFSSQRSFIDSLDKYNNLIILQTFSKAWGLAGLRLGMAFSSSFIIQLMNKVKPPYNINILTQKEALNALSHSEKVEQEIKNILAERDRLTNELATLEIVEHIFPSDSNFLLVRFRNAQMLFEHLINKGIIVRNRTKVMHGRECLRITVGTAEENTILINTLTEFINE